MSEESIFAKLVQTPRVVVEYSLGVISDNITNAVISLSIALAGVAAAWIIIKIAEWMTGTPSSKRWIHSKRDNHLLETTKKTWKSVIRMIAIVLAMLSLLCGFWISAAVLGVNFFSIALSYGIVALIISVSLSTTIKSCGAFLLIAATDKIEEDWVVEIAGQKGVITGIHILWIEMRIEGKNARGFTEIHVPTYLALDAVVKRFIQRY